MRVIVPTAVTDSVLTSSNIAETDFPAWSAATSYSAGTKVIRTTTHRIYEAIAPSLNQIPENDTTGTYWLEIGATNKWKPFDGVISDLATRAVNIEYTLTSPTLSNSIALFGLVASSVDIVITDPVDGVVRDESFELIDNSFVVDWLTYFYEPPSYSSELILNDMLIFTGTTIFIRINNPATAMVGEIVFGKDFKLGDTTTGTSLGIEDYSRKERDAFGNPLIVERAFASLVNFEFAMPSSDANRVRRIIAEVRAKPAVYYVGANTEQFGTTVYGFHRDFGIVLTSKNLSFANLEIEGLV